VTQHQIGKPASYASLSPYLVVSDARGLIDFVGAAFGATVLRQFDRPEPPTLGEQDGRHVVDAADVDAAGAQQGLQREVDDLLRLADHVGPALPSVEHVEGAEADVAVASPRAQEPKSRTPTRSGPKWATSRPAIAGP
jgi:hypothetical protein